MGLLQARILECVEGIKYSKVHFMACRCNSSAYSAQRSWAADCVCLCVCSPGCDAFSVRARRKGPNSTSGLIMKRRERNSCRHCDRPGRWTLRLWALGGRPGDGNESRSPGNPGMHSSCGWFAGLGSELIYWSN